MANEIEIIGILETLLTAFPAYKPVHPKKLAEIFTQKLSRFPVQVLQAAVDQVIETELRFFPSIGKLIQASEAAQDAYWQEYKRQSARRIELEERYWLRGQFERDDWEALAREMEKAGRIDGAIRLRAKAAIFAEETDGIPVQ